MAMEYLDDRKQEFHLLEIAVKRDMKAREKYLKVVRSEASQVGAERGRLLRRDVIKHILPKSKVFRCLISRSNDF